MTIRHVDHINIVSERLEATRAFYVDVLGLAEGPRPPFSSEGYWLYAGPKAVVHIQQSTGPVGPSTVCALNHAAFEVADFDGQLAKLDAHGVAYDLTTVPGTGQRQAFFLDPNGVRLEFGEPA